MAGCSGTLGRSEGHVRLSLSVPGGITITTVSYSAVSSTNAVLASGTFSVDDPNAPISLDIALPSGAGDKVSLSAQSTGSPVRTFAGTSAAFNVNAGTTTGPVNVTLTDAGSSGVPPSVVIITGTVAPGDNAPVIDSAVVAPATSTPLGLIHVKIVAHDPDAGNTLSFLWSTSAALGSFANPTAAETDYTSNTIGSQNLTVRVTDSAGSSVTARAAPVTIFGGDMPGGCHPILNGGSDTGFDSCDNGARLRRAVVTCPIPATTTMDPCAGIPGGQCGSDAECTAQPLGFCANVRHLAGYCGCFYGCTKDSDCASGSICECGIVTGQCTPASCTSGASCPPGAPCLRTLSAGSPVCNPLYPPSYACQTPTDACTGNGDCAGQNQCLFVGADRVCSVGGCPI
jgi:hypothetical protein